MKRSVVILGLALTLSAAIVGGCGAPSPIVTERPSPVPAESPVSTPVEMANPASVYCQEQGYTLEIRTDASGGQYGVCIFPDGSECDEWAFYRGECAPDSRTSRSIIQRRIDCNSMEPGIKGIVFIEAIQIDKRFDKEKADLLMLLEAKEAEYTARIEEYAEEIPLKLTQSLLQPETQAAITAAIKPAIEEIAPDLVDALVSKGATMFQSKSNATQSMAKAALNQGVDLEGLMAGIDPAMLQQGMQMLQQGQGGQVPPNIQGIIQAIMGQAIKGILPAQYRKLIPAGMNPFSLLSGMGGGGGSGGGNGGYSPGI